MVAKTRNLVRVFPKIGSCTLKNLLVSGCSYVWNNSEEHLCSWPYYLRDCLDFSQVYDCSQSGGGPENVFLSILNEIFTNNDISPKNTMVIIMWPELSRTDLIAPREICDDYHGMPKYLFNDFFSSFTIKQHWTSKNNMIEAFAKDYKKIISHDAQEYQSLLKILALDKILSQMGFTYLFLSWKKYHRKILLDHKIDTSIIDHALDLISPLETLDEYAERIKSRIPNDGHPTPDAHLSWTKEYLIPHLKTRFSEIIN